MRRMHSINILDYSIRSAQGDITDTLSAIKNKNIKISTKAVATLDDDIDVPYFVFENEVKDERDEITNAIKEIVSNIATNLSRDKKERTVLIIGTALVDKNVINAVEDKNSEYTKNPENFSKTSIDSYADDIAKELGLNSFTMTICTACTSSVNAILEARNLINAGLVDYAIVVGIEIFSKMMSGGFSSMNLLSLGEQKPFDKERDGLILGEAIAAVLLGRDDSSWSLRGGYSNCNSETITSVSASGDEFAEVMLNAMELSGVNAEDICAIKAHATSSLSNDLAEINAISELFSKEITFTAIKPYVGHTLGACGVLELAILMASVDDGFIPKTINHRESILQDYLPLKEHKVCKDGIFMLNYFGFGGNNTTIIIQKELV